MLTIPLLLSVINAAPATKVQRSDLSGYAAISSPVDWTWFFRLSTHYALTYQQALDTCSRRGQGICSVAELCPNGQADPSLEHIYGAQNWVAAGDSYNEWITFNRAGDRVCKTHTEIEGDKPAWGTQPDVVDFFRSVKCCDKKFDKVSPAESTDALIYQDAVDTCSSKGQKVCSVAELCPNGQPDPSLAGFALVNWIAVGDSENEWVTFHHKGVSQCKTHSEIAGDKPDWGLRSNAFGQSWFRSVKCCSVFDKQTPAGSSDALTHQAAVETCSSKGEKVCSVAELCPNGQPDPSLDVYGDIPHFIAVGDSKNEWTTFNRARDRQCKTRTEITGSTPEWGITTNGNDDFWSRVVKCCPLKKQDDESVRQETTPPLVEGDVGTCYSEGQRVDCAPTGNETLDQH